MTGLSFQRGAGGPSAPGEPRLVRMLTGYRRAEYLAGAGLWLTALAYFWVWWLEPRHHGNVLGTVLTTAILAWITLLSDEFTKLHRGNYVGARLKNMKARIGE